MTATKSWYKKTCRRVSASTSIADSIPLNRPQLEGYLLGSVVPSVTPAIDLRRCPKTRRLDIWVPEGKSRQSLPSISIVQCEPLSCSSLRLEPRAKVNPSRHRLKGVRIPPLTD